MGKSIYELIEKNIKDGVLNPEVSIRKDKFADGAVDGMYVYHMAHQEMGEEIKGKIAAVIKKACTGNYEKADKMYLEINKLTLEMIDDIQDVIYDLSEQINSDKLWLYIEHLMFESENAELVKLSLAIIEIFNIDDDEDLKGYIRTLGLSNEFSLFVIFNMRKWSNSDEEIWNLIKNVRGWGRVHGIAYMSSEISNEISTWILEEGWDNDVMPEYTAIQVWNKGKAMDKLRSGNMSEKEKDAIGNLIAISEADTPKPVACLESLDEYEEIKELYKKIN